MKYTLSIFLVMACMFVPTTTWAQTEAKTDSVPSTREEKNRNVMLNASNDREPRKISIGLPAQFASDIFEDGLPVSELYWPVMPYTTWRSGLSHGTNSLMSLSESALKYGKLGYIVSSTNRHAGDEFQGLAKYSANNRRWQFSGVSSLHKKHAPSNCGIPYL